MATLSNNVSFIDNIIEDNPDKYDTIIQSRIINKQLNLLLQQYNVIQTQYEDLIKSSLQNKLHPSIDKQDQWMDMNNQNYMYYMVPGPGMSNDNFKYLGDVNNLEECKIKAVNDSQNVYSSIIYNTSAVSSGFSNMCYGNVAGKPYAIQTDDGVITSLAPNGTTRIGGPEGERLLSELKRLKIDIDHTLKQQTYYNNKLKQIEPTLKTETLTENNDINVLLEQLDKNRAELNTIITEPSESSIYEDSKIQQVSNYTIYIVWITLVVLSLYVVLQVYMSSSYFIPLYVYIFVCIWLIILWSYYHQSFVHYISSIYRYTYNLFTNIPIL